MNSAAQTAREGSNSGNMTAGNGHDLRKTQPVSGDNYVELKYRSVNNMTSGAFAKGLGVFSVALGLAELLAPGRVGTMMGVGPKHRSFLPALGAREIAHGLAIFSSPKPTAAVWSRVGGDIVDLAFLASAFTEKNADTKRLAVSTVAILGAAAVDLACALQLSGQDWSKAGNPNAPTTLGQPSAR